MTEIEAKTDPIVFLEMPKERYGKLEDTERSLGKPETQVLVRDAAHTGLPSKSADVIVTSPPYWQKRNYGASGQIGLEATPEGYVSSILACMEDWKHVLADYGSIFLNVGDTYLDRCLTGIPAMLEAGAIQHGWVLRNRIIWAKESGMPEPATNRLANRYEFILHFTKKPTKYYYDLMGYAEAYGNGSNPGDVWNIALKRNTGSHLAPFPQELADRCITLACPMQVCNICGKPRHRVLARTNQLNPERPQARRAMELAREHHLTPEHIRAIQAFGISDTGKATQFQNGTGRSAENVVRLAAEAKEALGGYFREFTFAKKATIGWSDCGHNNYRRAVVLDPFVGTGTTLRSAHALGRDGIGIDIKPLLDDDVQQLLER